MSTPYLGEIRMVGFSFAPLGWALCDGSVLPISGNDALYTLIGTTYGGDGQTTFALPDLRSRVPMHQGNGHVLGEKAGTETVTLTTNHLPAHNHLPQADSNTGNSSDPAGHVWAQSQASRQYAAGTAANAPMNAGIMGGIGGSLPHDNMLPFLTVNFVICTNNGIFPSQN
jgi:microcystin-dependent protein